MIFIPAIYLPIHNGLIIIFTLAKYHCYAFSLSIVFNPAVWNPPASAGAGMRCNPREVALSSASRDNSTCKLQCTLFLKLGSHYYREPPASAGGGSTRTLGDFLDSPVEPAYCLINKCYREKSIFVKRCLIKDVTEAG